MNATPYLILFTASILTAILASYILLSTATTLTKTATVETNTLSNILTCVTTASNSPDSNLLSCLSSEVTPRALSR